MSVKTKIAGLVVALMALSVPMVYADNGASPDQDSSHHAGDWHHHGKKDHILAKVLNLSEDQTKQLKDIEKKQWEDLKSTFKDIKANRDDFEAEIAKATPDMSKITTLQTQFKTIQSQLVDDHLNSLLAIKKVLTPEQFAGYVALKKAERMTKHHHGPHGKFDHKGGICKKGDEHKDWGNKSDDDHDGDAE